MKSTEYWLSENELSELYTADYWNDIEEEKNKPWWIIDSDYEKLWKYLISNYLYQDYLFIEKKLKDASYSKIRITDLASGIGWVSALLSKLDFVDSIECIELSKHRIDNIFPFTIDMFNGDSTKINRYVGSFYNIKLQDESIDVAILSQAFHHAERPSDLLQEIHRILKRTGVVYIFGEHFIDWKKILWRFLSILLKKRKLIINFRELFPTDPVLGDHYYKISDYFKMAEAAGFSCTVDILPSGQALYTLYK